MGVKIIEELEGRALWLAHRKELVEQAHAHLSTLGIDAGIIMSGFDPTSGAPVQVASVQTLARREAPPADIIVIDECFPAGTMIDGRPIETVRVGDLVRSYNHAIESTEMRKIVKCFARRALSLVRVWLIGGQNFVCTPNHPVFALTGYAPAGKLLCGDMVVTIIERQGDSDASEKVCNLRDSVYAEELESEHDSILYEGLRVEGHCSKTQKRSASVLDLRQRNCSLWTRGVGPCLQATGDLRCSGVPPETERADDGGYQQEICLRAHEAKKSYEISRRAGQGVYKTAGHGLAAATAGREWRAHCATNAFGVYAGVVNGGGNSNGAEEGKWIPDLLQSGYWERAAACCDRGGRKQSQDAKTSSRGQEKRCVFAVVGVDRVEVLESTGDGRFGGLCPDGNVYNLEVENNHNYFANGILAHNCHHATAGSYRKLLERYNGETRVIGLTATPFRLDGRGLGGAGFDHIEVAAKAKELCDEGFLHKPRVFAGHVPDLRGLRVRMGDYAVDDLAERVNVAPIIGDIVSTWQERSRGRRTVAFAVNIAHSQAIVAAFIAAGVRAAHLDGTTPRKERESILLRLRVGVIDVVSNCMVLTEGWDLPALETAIIARPTASLNLHLQMIGRIMRAAIGKDGALVLDHAGNHHIHGMVTREIEYSLEGRVAGEANPLGLRRCPECGILFEPGEGACPDCDWRPAVGVRAGEDVRAIVHGDGALAQFDDECHEYRAEFYRLLDVQREAMGFQPGWAAYRFKERFGVWPTVAEGELVDGVHATHDQKRAVYQQLLTVARSKGFKDGWAAHRYRNQFGVWPRGVG